MKFSYYYLPNSLVEKKMLPSDFAVAAFSLFYGTSLRKQKPVRHIR